MFEYLVKGIKPFLPESSCSLSEAEDGLAMYLCRLRTAGPPEQLLATFQCGTVNLQRLLRRTREALLQFFKEKDKLGQVKYPSPEEAERQWEEVQEKYGAPPFHIKRPIVVVCDSMTTRVHPPSEDNGQESSGKVDQELAAFYRCGKDHFVNHILDFDADECIVDFSINHPGSVHDSRCAAPMIRGRHKDEDFNPAKVGMVVAESFTGFDKKPAEDVARVFRPWKKEKFSLEDR